MMTKPEFRNYHEREAARLRAVLVKAITPLFKGRLLEAIEKHERLARGESEAMVER
jgi:hypothetical protein